MINFSTGAWYIRMLSHLNEKPVNPKNVIVLGGSGVIGSDIVKCLEKQGVTTTSISSKEINLEEPYAGEELSKIISGHPTLITVAGLAPVKNYCDFNRAMKINASIARAVELSEIDHIINISSDSIFGETASAINEYTCRSPETLYGASHLARELLLCDAAHSTPFASIRQTLLFGSGFSNNGYSANTFIKQSIENEQITIFGDGQEERDHVWLRDLSRLVVKIAEHKSHGSLNAASGYCLSFREIAKEIARIRGHSDQLRSVRQNGKSHSLRRFFDNRETFRAFPDFKYTPPMEALKFILDGSNGFTT